MAGVLGKRRPGIAAGEWGSRHREPNTQPPRQGNTHHLDNLCLAFVLQAAFQVLGSALLLLLECTGEGAVGLGAEGPLSLGLGHSWWCGWRARQEQSLCPWDQRPTVVGRSGLHLRRWAPGQAAEDRALDGSRSGGSGA